MSKRHVGKHWNKYLRKGAPLILADDSMHKIRDLYVSNAHLEPAHSMGRGVRSRRRNRASGAPRLYYKKVLYGDRDIRTHEGLKNFLVDYHLAFNYLERRFGEQDAGGAKRRPDRPV